MAAISNIRLYTKLYTDGRYEICRSALNLKLFTLVSTKFTSEVNLSKCSVPV
jgi:hypothetical protein